MAIDPAEISWISGDDVILRFRLNDSAGSPIPTSDIQALQSVKYAVGENTITPSIVFMKEDFSVDAEGRINVRITPSDSDNLSGIFCQEMQIIDNTGAKTTVFSNGTLTINADLIED